MTPNSDDPALFRPIQVGDVTVRHRVVLAPLTRCRADDAHIPTDLMVEYYRQRSCVPGTLLISEAAIVAPQAGGLLNAPGIWDDQQVAAWRKVTDAVHQNGCYVFLQLWAMGRAARPAVMKKDMGYQQVAPSPIALSTHPDDVPRELSRDEIAQYARWFADAAARGVHEAGFDGVEIHGANGYLIDQFLQEMSNNRADEYGGSIENRARFALEVVDAVVDAVGQSKTAIRLSPWNRYQDMGMDDPVPTFGYLVNQLKERYPSFAFIHVVSPHAMGNELPKYESMVDFIHDLWAPRPLISTGGYTRATGLKQAEERGQLIGYGVAFLSNPDLPYRLREDLPLNVPDVGTFYSGGGAEGYTTYPFCEGFLARSRWSM
ncbi:NADH:flavin oxidoreductase/NADH oxidase [Daedaleopsis nitida]|nr:NADH:flavin oxidoreductase/NADH oxidase [Daedaleopsis nitida]